MPAGRITPAAAALGTILKIKPVLQIQGEKLDAFAKARTFSAANTTMINALKADVEGRISENGKYKFSLHIAEADCAEQAVEIKNELHEVFGNDVEIEPQVQEEVISTETSQKVLK